ncbi:agmatinase [Maribacter sp. 2307ULW6-5]|uniref:agmatinase n=1 Tax=Maribacter sp. 2307ULW6-5 TaxID=3386275 RepID=UPI0039BD04E6
MIGKIALQGLLFDAKSSFLTGPAKAPPLIREAYKSESANYFAEDLTEIRPDRFQDLGDFKVRDYMEIQDIAARALKNHDRLLTLGGDHSVTYPVLQAFYNKYGPLDVLHLDAHADLYDSFGGDRHSHACPFARIMEKGLAKRLVQVGIRTLSQHQWEQAKKYGVEVIQMKQLDMRNLPLFNNALYISVDMDVLDPAFAPGVSHHEPGGLTIRQLLHILQHVDVPVLGADIVEYNPTRDVHGMTAMVCAKILKEIAAKMISS